MEKQCKTCLEFKIENLFRTGSRICRSCKNLTNKKLYQKDKDRILQRNKNYYKDNKELILEQKKERFEENKESLSEAKASYNKDYYKKNKTKINKQNASYAKQREIEDPFFKAKKNIRARAYSCFKNKYPKSKKSLELIGCPWENLREYLEMQFIEGMTWDNYGFYGWHVDHIIPLASAKTIEEVEALCHYTNLQPLWAEDNLKKGDSIIDEGLNKK